jgi:protein-disulfide isomerase-like protein with CxxC motif
MYLGLFAIRTCQGFVNPTTLVNKDIEYSSVTITCILCVGLLCSLDFYMLSISQVEGQVYVEGNNTSYVDFIISLNQAGGLRRGRAAKWVDQQKRRRIKTEKEC